MLTAMPKEDTLDPSASAAPHFVQIVQTLTAPDSLLTRLKQLMQPVLDQLDFETAVLLLTNPLFDGPVCLPIWRRSGLAGPTEPFCWPTAQAIIDHLGRTGRPILISHIAPAEQRFISLGSWLQIELRNMLCLPLAASGRTSGVLIFLNKADDIFTRTNLAWAKTSAAYTALIIENAYLQMKLHAEEERNFGIETQVRRKVAGDLHDGPTQLVSALLMGLDYCLAALKADPARVPAEISALQQLGQRAIHQLRTKLVELRPLELEEGGRGLAAALRVFLERRQADSAIPRLILETSPGNPAIESERRDMRLETTIFNVVREVVNNAFKHAQADTIRVRLGETPTTVYATITDDGQGFDVQETLHHYATRGSLGLRTIHERVEAIGGRLTIQSAPGQGTCITLAVPKVKDGGRAEDETIALYRQSPNPKAMPRRETGNRQRNGRTWSDVQPALTVMEPGKELIVH